MAIQLTATASSELKVLRDKEIEAGSMKADAGLRLMVKGGGCSGFTYKMAFDEHLGDQDKVFEIDGLKVVVDERSFFYIDGTEIDYHDGLMGRGFVFKNPNATGTCGCGSSFSV